MADPLHDPVPPTEVPSPGPSLRANRAFMLLWSAATVSVFGSFVTRIAIPFVAIETLAAGAIEVAILRVVELIAALLVGFVAGAWVDRLRRRKVMIVADVGRALLLGSIPVAAIGGWISLPQVFAVAALAAVLTTFFDVADKAYLPTIVPRSDLVRANGAIAATSSAVEFAGFGLGGVLVQVLTAPIAILVDAVTFVGSALLLGAIRHPEPAPPPPESRAPILTEIRAGMRLVAQDPILRGLLWGTVGVSGQWGVFGSVWLLFATKEVGLDAAVIGVIAAIGGLGSLGGALLASRTAGRYGLGRLVVVSVAVAAFANVLIAVAPAALPLVAVACFLGQQLIGDSALTMYDVTEVSIRQSRVDTAQLGRVNGTVRVVAVMAQLGGAVLAGVVGELVGLRVAAFLGPAIALVGAAGLWLSPVGRFGANPTRS